MKGYSLLIALVLFALSLTAPASAQEANIGDTRNQTTALTTKYSGKRGVMAMSCNDGIKLRTAKSILRKDFGEEFAKSVEAFTIIVYKDASAEEADLINKDIAQITNALLQIDLKDKIKKEETEAYGYVQLSPDKKFVNDIVVVFKKPAPMLIYIGGKFNADNM